MHDIGMMDVNCLMERAARCREIAWRAMSEDLITEMEDMAEAYDKEAAQTTDGEDNS